MPINLSQLIYGAIKKDELDEIISRRYFGERVYIDPPMHEEEIFNLIALANNLYQQGAISRTKESPFELMDAGDYSVQGPFCLVMGYLSKQIEFIKNGADPGDYSSRDLENFCDESIEDVTIRFGNYTIGKRLD
ncbi:hypothetical protein [Sphingobacterium suaedae]|uniref:Uncharacterized protein n=1 Tax=Sphingobacterium suaedae TaxID=1686402 RepID=A0ABW5KEI5_9SPHI